MTKIVEGKGVMKAKGSGFESSVFYLLRFPNIWHVDKSLIRIYIFKKWKNIGDGSLFEVFPYFRNKYWVFIFEVIQKI